MGYLCQQFDDAINAEYRAINRLWKVGEEDLIIGTQGGANYVLEAGYFGTPIGREVKSYGNDAMQKQYGNEQLLTLEQVREDLEVISGLSERLFRDVHDGVPIDDEYGHLLQTIGTTDFQYQLEDVERFIQETDEMVKERGYDVENTLSGKCTFSVSP